MTGKSVVLAFAAVVCGMVLGATKDFPTQPWSEFSTVDLVSLEHPSADPSTLCLKPYELMAYSTTNNK